MKKVIANIIAFLSFPFTALAAAGDFVGTIDAPQTIVKQASDTGKFLTVIINFVTVVAGIYALWQFLTGGFGYITSAGDKGKVQQSTQQILMAVTGMAVIAASFILASIIGKIFFGSNFDLLSPVLQQVK